MNTSALWTVGNTKPVLVAYLVAVRKLL